MAYIREINDPQVKSEIANKILHALPKWFGIEKSIQDYIQGVKERVFFAAIESDEAIGFLCIKENNQFTAELYVLGLLESYHRKGIGQKLLFKAEKYLRDHNYRFLMVKTLGDSCDYEYYRRTREFYKSRGFYPLEEIVEIWGEENPCLIMIKIL